MKWASFMLLGCAGSVFAQPFIYAHGVVNAASSLPFAIPAGAIARGSIFTIYGKNLGPATPVQANTYPLGTTLGNVSVTVGSLDVTVNALPIYVSSGQVNAILPSNAPTGAVSVRVQVGNNRSNPMMAMAAANNVGIFTVRGTGNGPAVIQNFVTAAEQPVNSLQTPARPGQTVILWATGLGAVANDTIAPSAGDLPVTVEVLVGGKVAQKSYAGRAPCCAGTDQIVFQVPADAPTGCWVPVYLRVAGTAVSNVTTMAVTADGAPCGAQENRAGAALLSSAKVGLLAPLRAVVRQSFTTPFVEFTTDFLVSRFAQETNGAFAFNPLFSLPPAGTCTSYSGSGDWLTSAAVPGIQGLKSLDAGGFTLSGSGKSATFPVTYSPLSLGYLGYNAPIVTSRDTSLLAPGPFTIQSQGGTDIPALNTSFTMISPLTWTNRDQFAQIDAAAGFTLNWTGGSGQTVAAVGGSVDVPSNASTLFLCIASPGATSITVPPAILANLPPGRGTRQTKTIVFLAAGSASAFNANGIDAGVLAPTYLTGKAVTLK
jgi:uncharacterized protein (TIGR03437 family)